MKIGLFDDYIKFEIDWKDVTAIGVSVFGCMLGYAIIVIAL